MSRQSRPILLLTRPKAASQRFALQARAAFGADLPVEIAPLMAPVFYAPPLPEAPPRGMIFTSETGVEAFARLESRRGPAICVGPRTAEAAEAMGWQAEVVGGDAEGLVRELTARGLPGRWLHARGREAAGGMAGRLNAAGLQVDEAVVYAQEPLPLSARATRLLQDCPDQLVIPVFSPRSGTLLVQAAGGKPLTALRLAVISAAAAQTVAPFGARALEVAPTPDLAGMLAALSRLPGIASNA